MKKVLLTFLFLILFIPNIIFGSEKDVNMYLFYGDGCPHCKALEIYLDGYLEKNKNVHLYSYEIWHNDENVEKYKQVHEILNQKGSGIPYLIIGETSIIGFDEEFTPERIKNAVTYYSNIEFNDKVGVYLGIVEDKDIQDNNVETKEYIEKEFDLPILGKKKSSEIPLILASIIIGFVDGINPCSMWILVLLLSLLLGIRNKKKRFILGMSFILASGLVYFLFLTSWLNLATFLNKIAYIRLAIAFITIIFGGYSVIKFINTKNNECDVVDEKNKKNIIKSVKRIIKEKSLPFAILGVVLLAIASNIVELLCSLGLPVMFSEIIALNDVSTSGRIIYSLIYILFFLIDDIVIFIIAMKTLKVKSESVKFNKYARLIAGLLMVLIGTLIILRPEWLMFNF